MGCLYTYVRLNDPFLPTLNLSVLFELCSYLHVQFAHPDCAVVFASGLFVSPAGMVKINHSVNDIELTNLGHLSSYVALHNANLKEN